MRRLNEFSGVVMRNYPDVIIVALLLLVSAGPAVAGPLGQSVADMASNCEVFRTVDPRGEELAFNSDFRSGVCWGSFLSFFHFGSLIEGGERSPLHICAAEKCACGDLYSRVYRLCGETSGIRAGAVRRQCTSCPHEGISLSGRHIHRLTVADYRQAKFLATNRRRWEIRSKPAASIASSRARLPI